MFSFFPKRPQNESVLFLMIVWFMYDSIYSRRSWEEIIFTTNGCLFFTIFAFFPQIITITDRYLMDFFVQWDY